MVADLDGDGAPEIVFFEDGGDLVALDGRDCSERWRRSVVALGFGHWSTLAIGDLDDDRRAEIVACTDSSLMVLDSTGSLLAEGATQDGWCGTPSIANVDGQGPPEIVLAATTWRYDPSGKTLTKIADRTRDPLWASTTNVADVWQTGEADVLQGYSILRAVDGLDLTPSTFMGTNLSADTIIDMNGDGSPEIVTMSLDPTSSMEKMSVYDLRNSTYLLAAATVPLEGSASNVLADLDGDGHPDIAFGSSEGYSVYTTGCMSNPTSPGCAGSADGLAWFKAFQDVSSTSSSSTIFDFNGDGVEEVIYRDECWLRIMDSRTGEVLAAVAIQGITIDVDGPSIADTDGDGSADILVPSENGGVACAGDERDTHVPRNDLGTGLYVLSSPTRSYDGTRALWTDFNYHVTEINDDLSVPTHETASWLSDNTYRVNTHIPRKRAAGAGALPDITASHIVQDGQSGETLRATVCNRGAVVAPAGVAGVFSTRDAAGRSTPACIAYTTMDLQPGQCEVVWCTSAQSCAVGTTIVFTANDHGNARNRIDECRATNDVTEAPCAAAN